MELEPYLKNPQYRYLVCYISDNEFWCVEERPTIEMANKELNEQQTRFPKKQFLIIKRITTHEIV
jgi:hypothetical protein